MDFKDKAAKLTEKIYSLSGSNEANECQRLIEDALREVYILGYNKAINMVATGE